MKKASEKASRNSNSFKKDNSLSIRTSIDKNKSQKNDNDKQLFVLLNNDTINLKVKEILSKDECEKKLRKSVSYKGEIEEISHINEEDNILEILDDEINDLILEGKSYFIFSSSNKIRIVLYRIISHDYFDYSMFLLVILNCITMALEHPRIQQNTFEYKFLNITNIIFSIIFGIEFIMKSIALSFHTYIKGIANKVLTN